MYFDTLQERGLKYFAVLRIYLITVIPESILETKDNTLTERFNVTILFRYGLVTKPQPGGSSRI